MSNTNTTEKYDALFDKWWSDVQRNYEPFRNLLPTDPRCEPYDPFGCFDAGYTPKQYLEDLFN